METSQMVIILIIVLFVLIGVIIALRELFCWYWKINSIINNQRLTNDLLLKLYMQMGGSKNNLPTINADAISNKDEVIIRNKETGSTEKMTWKQWNTKIEESVRSSDTKFEERHEIIEVIRTNS